MSQGLCPSCGAAVKLTAGQTDTKCTYCDSVVTLQQAEAQLSEVKNSKVGGALLLAQVAQEGGDNAEAIRYYNQIIEQQPDLAEAWLNKGICTFDYDSLSPAVSSWKAAIRFSKHPVSMKSRVAIEFKRLAARAFKAIERDMLRTRSQWELEYYRKKGFLESALALDLEVNPTEPTASDGLFYFATGLHAVTAYFGSLAEYGKSSIHIRPIDIHLPERSKYWAAFDFSALKNTISFRCFSTIMLQTDTVGCNLPEIRTEISVLLQDRGRTDAQIRERLDGFDYITTLPVE